MEKKYSKRNAIKRIGILGALLGVLAMVLTLHKPSATHADDGKSRQETGVSTKGLRGYNRVGLPVSSAPSLTLSGAAGYRFTESIGPLEGDHHGMFGRVALGAAVLPYLSLGLHLDGRYDKHPDDEDGADSSLAGEPRLSLRGGYPLSDLFQLGAEVVVWVPGAEAPSMDWDATTVDAQLLAAFGSMDGPWSVGALAGFRIDNSANSAPDLTLLRQGDRIALGLSDFHAVLVGLGGSYRFSGFEVFGEVTADILVGSDAPSFTESPLRVALGARYTFIEALQLELLAEAGLSERPGVAPTDPLIPIEPRFGVTLGLSYTWDFSDEEEKTPEPEPEPEPASVEPAPEPEPTTAIVSGVLVDEDGAPVEGATVTVLIDEERLEIVTDSAGAYSIEGVPVGEAKLNASADDFETVEWTVMVTPGMPLIESPKLIKIASGSQLRGLVRSFNGKGIRASITVQPLGIKTNSNTDGVFQLDVPPGKYTVIIEAPRYEKQKRKVVVEENSVTILNVDLRIK